MLVEERIPEQLAPSRINSPKLRIEPTKGWVSLRLKELWKYRELLYFLAWRDVKIRYKQTVLGAAWAIIQPIMTMLVFSVFFGKLGKIPSDGVPYPLFAFAGLLPWTFFAAGLQKTSDSLVSSSNLIKKVYFPRLIIPFSAILSGLPDLGLSFLVLIGMMVYFRVSISFSLIWLIPGFVILTVITSLGVGLWLSALNVSYRDVRYTVPFIIQFWMFVTPIAYPASLLPNWLQTFYAVNPMVGVVEGFRWALLGTDNAPGAMLIVSVLIAIVLLISGMFYFRRLEKRFADIV